MIQNVVVAATATSQADIYFIHSGNVAVAVAGVLATS